MSTTNCINCGAIKELDAMKCPYCGTLYLDLTALDLDYNTPVACVFKMPSCFSNVEKITMLAQPFLESIEQDEPDEYALYCDNHILSRVRSPSIPLFNFQFRPVPQHGGRFMTVYTKKKLARKTYILIGIEVRASSNVGCVSMSYIFFKSYFGNEIALFFIYRCHQFTQLPTERKETEPNEVCESDET